MSSPKILMYGIDPVSNLRLKHGQARIERELKSRQLDVTILAGGGVVFIATIVLQKFGYELLGEQVLNGWPLKIIGGTLILFALRKLIRQAWYKGDDTIYEGEIKRLTEL